MIILNRSETYFIYKRRLFNMTNEDHMVEAFSIFLAENSLTEQYASDITNSRNMYISEWVRSSTSRGIIPELIDSFDWGDSETSFDTWSGLSDKWREVTHNTVTGDKLKIFKANGLIKNEDMRVLYESV